MGNEAGMTIQRHHPAWGLFATFGLAFGLGVYFTFAAVQGDFGLFRRAEILSETSKLERELLALRIEVQRMENLTKRMSDKFLDLDLLDQQARDILGYVRGNEIVIY